MTWLEPVSDSLIASNRPSINKDPTGNYHVGLNAEVMLEFEQ